ncbi:MAG: Bifunctional ligase/repressor BirA [Pelotomaculum sp. PtaB.Bin117]|nr:MAG: Bifunctional ligase/repressor BirA [Pelotomaculum sp. PtaB.Bin117]OPY63270.1 MAG: Bifunctional ligase/repressor BirA [Pelotomaculum sp. PtaU1.Bin065]
MKRAVLRLLKEFQPEFVSGEDICKKLDVTRTAVWKHIQTLREDGYGIDARPRAGYSLVRVPDRLYAEEILDGLNSKFFGQQVYYYDSVSSTNDMAKELVRQGARDGSIVVAEEQTGGKGRLGRKWHSPKYKNVCFSVILYPSVNPSEASQMTMVTAVALALAVRKKTGVPVGIKWPNDLFVGGRKICGILTEMSAELDRIDYLVVGAGLNVNQELIELPEEVRDIATSLKVETGAELARVDLLQAMLEEYEQWYQLWLEQGFPVVLAKWKELSVSLHCPVRVHTLNKSWEGWAEDVDYDGALLLRLPDGGLQRLIVGDVSLRV